MFKYETHLHTSPVSYCARYDVRVNMEFYKEMGYAGVFITNHFIDGNINVEIRGASYAEKIEYYCRDYELAKSLEEEIGIHVFFGLECSYGGTDFLVYGIDKEWLLAHPEIESMKKSSQLKAFMEAGALVIQAHPFRDSDYIDHIRLFPRVVHGVEVVNSSRNDFENAMAKHYADSYGLIEFAGSDNHSAHARRDSLAGLAFNTPISDVEDFIRRVKAREHKLFFPGSEELDNV